MLKCGGFFIAQIRRGRAKEGGLKFLVSGQSLRQDASDEGLVFAYRCSFSPLPSGNGCLVNPQDFGESFLCPPF